MLILLVTVLAYFGGCLLLARSYLRPLRNVPPLPAGFREVTIPGAPLPIPAWEVGTPNATTTFIFAHGYGGSRADWTETMRSLQDLGIRSVALAMPGQDASPDPTVGFGIKEADAIEAASRWIRDRHPDGRIVGVGLSMGGAATWIAAGRGAPLDAVATEGAYARFDEASEGWIARLFPGARWVLAPVIPMGKWMSGLNPDRETPLAGASRWKGPALVIQGAEDRLIGMSHAERLAEASGARLWIVPGARHAQCQSEAPLDYAWALADLAAKVAERAAQ